MHRIADQPRLLSSYEVFYRNLQSNILTIQNPTNSSTLNPGPTLPYPAETKAVGPLFSKAVLVTGALPHQHSSQ